MGPTYVRLKLKLDLYHSRTELMSGYDGLTTVSLIGYHC